MSVYKLEPLLPCPFCGSRAVVVDSCWVRCHGCLAETRDHDTARDAVAAWNSRALPSLTEEEKEEAVMRELERAVIEAAKEVEPILASMVQDLSPGARKAHARLWDALTRLTAGTEDAKPLCLTCKMPWVEHQFAHGTCPKYAATATPEPDHIVESHEMAPTTPEPAKPLCINCQEPEKPCAKCGASKELCEASGYCCGPCYRDGCNHAPAPSLPREEA